MAQFAPESLNHYNFNTKTPFNKEYSANALNIMNNLRESKDSAPFIVKCLI